MKNDKHLHDFQKYKKQYECAYTQKLLDMSYNSETTRDVPEVCRLHG